tara:strand:+ start:225 stop:473 length:249 start_codon:yes stop_codon:yes gene_type:complete
MKTFEFLTVANKWRAIVDKGYQAKKKSGVPCRVVHPNGSWKVIANVDAMPEGMETRFKAEPVPSVTEAVDNLAKTGQTVLPA